MTSGEQIKKLFSYLFCDMYVYAHTQHCVHVEVKDNILESVISFHHVSPKDQAKVGHQD